MAQGGKHITRNIITYTLLALLVEGSSIGSKSNQLCIANRRKENPHIKYYRTLPYDATSWKDTRQRRNGSIKAQRFFPLRNALLP
jgi:hypothetical protein